MIAWPAIIKHSNDAQLIHISNQAEWDMDIDLHSAEYDETDKLIDSSGQLSTLTNRENNFVKPEANGVTLKLNEILGLVKTHTALCASCCVAKLHAPTISDAYKIAESFKNNLIDKVYLSLILLTALLTFNFTRPALFHVVYRQLKLTYTSALHLFLLWCFINVTDNRLWHLTQHL